MAISITVSIVSHGQTVLANRLVQDLVRSCSSELRIIFTQNIAESEQPQAPDKRHRFEVIANEQPRGFAANHNAAFRLCASPLFCVINPDVRLAADPFPLLTATLDLPRVAAAGPLVLDPQGSPEDSARRFPTVARLIRKLLSTPSGPDYPTDAGPLGVDWIAGMFILFRTDALRAVRGFDERFFLYYEDVDVCHRLRAAGYSIVYDPRVSIVHDARRASRRNPRLMAIHATSALRYLTRRYG